MEYILFPKDGHSLTHRENGLVFIRKLEDFLAEHLGGRSAGFDYYELGLLIFYLTADTVFHIDIVIGNEFMGTLPDDIDTITVTGPKGDLSLAKEDFNYYPQFRNKLFGKSDNDEIKVELYPETASQFYGTSSVIGGFKFKFVKNQRGNVNQFFLHCAPRFASMTIPFDKIK